jgi:hypothetical protein
MGLRFRKDRLCVLTGPSLQFHAPIRHPETPDLDRINGGVDRSDISGIISGALSNILSDVATSTSGVISGAISALTSQMLSENSSNTSNSTFDTMSTGSSD